MEEPIAEESLSSPKDAELSAIDVILALPEDAQKRAVRYLMGRVLSGDEVSAALADALQQAQSPPSESAHEQLIEIINRRPELSMNYWILLAMYLLKKVEGRGVVSTRDVSDVLKRADRKIGNPASHMRALRDRQPAWILVTNPNDGARQYRYRLSEAGEKEAFRLSI